jgi:uncharacterized protein YjaZ
MDGTDVSNWLFQGDRAKNRPADLGYYIGYKICESYYKQAANKKDAIKSILEVRDFNEFLKASKYESKFAVLPQANFHTSLHAASRNSLLVNLSTL